MKKATVAFSTKPGPERDIIIKYTVFTIYRYLFVVVGVRTENNKVAALRTVGYLTCILIYLVGLTNCAICYLPMTYYARTCSDLRILCTRV